MSVDVLAIGAHMGDEVAWGLALAAQRRLGNTVGMLHLTPGEKGHPTMEPEAYAAQKSAEAEACGAVLGARVWSLPYKDGELPTDEGVKMAVARVLREAQPRCVVTHWPGSMHKDHAATAALLPDALFYAALRQFDVGPDPITYPRVLHGENWEDMDGFVPDVALEATEEDLELWERAMRCYALFRGEWKTFPYLDYYRSLARARGCVAGCAYAVCFASGKSYLPRRTVSLV